MLILVWVVIDLPNSAQYNRLTDGLMGVCLDPSDCNYQIIGLSVRPFNAYGRIGWTESPCIRLQFSQRYY